MSTCKLCSLCGFELKFIFAFYKTVSLHITPRSRVLLEEPIVSWAHLVKKFLTICRTWNLLPCSQEPAIGPHPAVHWSNPHPYTPFIYDPFDWCYGVVSQKASQVLWPLLNYCASPSEFWSFLIHPPELSGSNLQTPSSEAGETWREMAMDFADLSISFILNSNMP
jgi:hypothetical protein